MSTLEVIDRTGLPHLADRLRQVLIGQELDRPLLDHSGIHQLQTKLSGSGLPQRDIVARALGNDDAADVLTEHQAVILDAIRLLPRVECAAEPAAARPSCHWEHDLPRQMAELAAGLPHGQRFDSVVIDEAQDFADPWWEPILASDGPKRLTSATIKSIGRRLASRDQLVAALPVPN